MTAGLVLYTNPQSRGRIVRWMLEEVAAPYRAEIVDYGPAMKSPEYRRLNPMGKVPTLVHGDRVVTECAAICAYLADAFPQSELAPPPGDRADYYRWMFFGAGPFEAAVTNQALAVHVPEEKRGFVGYGSLEEVLDALDLRLQKSPFLAGDRFTAADVYAGSQIGFGLQFGTIPTRPSFASYVSRITMRPAAVRARELDDAAAAARA